MQPVEAERPAWATKGTKHTVKALRSVGGKTLGERGRPKIKKGKGYVGRNIKGETLLPELLFARFGGKDRGKERGDFSHPVFED